MDVYFRECGKSRALRAHAPTRPTIFTRLTWRAQPFLRAQRDAPNHFYAPNVTRPTFFTRPTWRAQLFLRAQILRAQISRAQILRAQILRAQILRAQILRAQIF